MSQQFYLAWAYLKYHWLKTLVLIVAISLVLFIPLGLNTLSKKGSKNMMARAENTPLLVGAKGSDTELNLSALYFKKSHLDPIPHHIVSELVNTKLGAVIPLHLKYQVKNQPIVGTSSEYFKFRKTSFQSGRPMAMLGECVLGSEAAKILQINLGESVISSPASTFDIAGSYPLKMTVVGILNPTGTPDDNAVFTDIKTTWVISGLAHGHENLNEKTADSLVLSKSKTEVVASPAILSYTEITPENIDSFHFHGNPEEFPLQALIINPTDKKGSLMLRGRFENRTDNLHIVVPKITMKALLDTVLSVKDLIMLAAISIGIATLIILTLVFSLSLQLRKGEINTMNRIGGASNAIQLVLSLEIIITIGIGILLAALLVLTLNLYGPYLIEKFIL
ncbi:hypothetical protein Q4566_13890 [Tamlana sp. 2_MG-2023]|uniref:ABC transporter permease n=1 Tax=unclassified Tamlana TaxID=2614803 RepID=UPI0026E282CE|nr:MULTISPECIES: ABC transporter permease [unclassified Tamlana]MDO6761298.1 hypothetical protein [Tamlana sp. 2_MG-2023]MDO6791781.1 hypothetical protein [Tamlana sp. 1_MG-2023]